MARGARRARRPSAEQPPDIERELELEHELETLRARVRSLEEEVREYHVQEKITALARYEGNPGVRRSTFGTGTNWQSPRYAQLVVSWTF